MFLQNSLLQTVISGIGVLVFTALTAYDTQKIKEQALEMGHEGEAGAKVALLGALTLYLDFINLFLFLLRFFGDRR
jgi:FtsH-binding integral membrane protein